jgi:hypothetical protein
MLARRPDPGGWFRPDVCCVPEEKYLSAPPWVCAHHRGALAQRLRLTEGDALLHHDGTTWTRFPIPVGQVEWLRRWLQPARPAASHRRDQAAHRRGQPAHRQRPDLLVHLGRNPRPPPDRRRRVSRGLRADDHGRRAIPRVQLHRPAATAADRLRLPPGSTTTVDARRGRATPSRASTGRSSRSVSPVRRWQIWSCSCATPCEVA